MKRLMSILVISFSLIFTDCNDQLDLKPLGQLDESTYYQTEKDFEAASLSPYSTLLNLYYDQSGLGWYQAVLFPDDDVQPPHNSNNDQEDFNWNTNNGQFYYLWKEFYKGIQRANVIIDRLPEAKGFADESKKLRFEAEARFLRAYFHFLLAINFGNAPVSMEYIASLEESRKPNSQPGEIWNAVITDLEFAQSNLPESWNANNVGRATSGAATALLGKTYLYRAQWEGNDADYDNAITEFNKLIGKYSLIPNYGNNFSINAENNAESVFEIQFTRGDFNPWLPTDFALAEDQNIGAAGTGRLVFWRPACGPAGNTACAPGANGLGYGQVHVTSTLQAEYETNDPRRAETIYIDGDVFADGQNFSSTWSVTGSTPAKYVKQEDLAFRFPLNWSGNNDRIIRYADVLLMLAEARLLGNADVAGAASLINQVRRRADPGGTILPDRPAGATVDEMFDFLMHERRIELALEGHRYFDLVRWHRAGLIDIATDIDFGRTTPNQRWSTKNLVKPIPQRELDLNQNLQQHPEYL